MPDYDALEPLATDPNDPSLGGNLIGGDPDSYHPALWSYLIERFGIRSMLDVGCGEGHCVKFFASEGVTAIGFDGLEANVERAVAPILLHDLRNGPFVKPVDLVHCCEVVEHIDERYVDNVFATLASGNVIAMTHALPGQGGYHHVNCQTASYWITRLEALGYTFLPAETHAAKARISESGAWSYFLQSGLIFQKGAPQGSEIVKPEAKMPAKPGWWLRIAGENRAEFTRDPADPEHVRVTIHKFTASANHDIQLNQSRYEVVGGTNYRITFRGRADADRDVSIAFSMASEPWLSLGLYRQIRFTAEWRDYREDFTATSDHYFSRIHFDLGSAGTSVDLSSVRLWQVSDSGVTEVERIEVRPLPRSISHESLPAAAPQDAGPSWVIAAPNPPNPRTLPDFRMFAVLGTWMEEDVVAATVCNALAQGCERVYLVDNGSTDGTVDAALRAGAILGRSFRTDRYDEGLRLRHMNEVVAEVSLAEGDQHIWWLFLDADEFPHGPWGMTLREYLATLDERFRVVGTRFFNHYPSGTPHYEPGRHPLDFQPLCEELAFPMCAQRHRKHPLLRFDRGRAPIECGEGFHAASCAEQLHEPTQPAFLHHFPFREETVTRQRLESLWAKDGGGATRAVESRDTHILSRFRSMNAVYAQEWAKVENFIALDPLNQIVKAAASGVTLKPWTEMVEAEHQPIFRWYATSMTGAWKYQNAEKFRYGDDTTYKKGIAFLDGHGLIEDWGCGFAHARSFVTQSAYRGIDGSSQHADEIVDLREYRSQADCIFMRHVLEHNTDWSRILANAVASFQKRMALIIFTPLSEATRVIATSTSVTAFPVPDISFRREDLTRHFQHLKYSEESLATDTQYGVEHVFYIERNPSPGAAEPFPGNQQLEQELNAWRSAGLTAKFWWRDDDAITDTPQLRRLLDLARQTGIVPAIAVVPERADQALRSLLSSTECCVWQHGWGHYSHEAGEFGEGRALDLMVRDALSGQQALDRLFAPGGWQRVFVPPFHLLSMRFKALIPSLGYRGVSAGVELTPRIDHVAEVNAEIDVMNWPAQRMLGGAEITRMVVQQLAARRLGRDPIDQPIGLLTHHLVFGDNEWRSMADLFQSLLAHPAVRFERAATLFPPADRLAMLFSPENRLATVTAPMGTAAITVVVTSCGRQDLLERTLDSFLKYNTYPVHEFVVIEDGAGDANRRLAEKYRPCNFKWLATGKRIGQMPAIDEAYRQVETEYIFHCEDDWEFTTPGFIERSLAVLTANPIVLQVWIRALTDTNHHPVMEPTLFAGRVPYRLLQPGFHTDEWGTWHGFSFNPGLRRRRDYESIGSFGSFDPARTKRPFEIEREVSAAYLKLGFLAAILADNQGAGYVKHIGWGRRVEGSAS